MNLGRLHHQSGIALGTILFIIAALAVLAVAIAAGSSGFNANTQTESAKAMAEALINSCSAYRDALNLMYSNGCNIAQLDFTPTGGNWPTGSTWTNADYTGGNGTGHTGNGQCAMFDPRGGGMVWKPVPSAALANPSTGLYNTSPWGDATNANLFVGYPMFAGTHCVSGVGTCTAALNANLVLNYFPINQNVCVQINTILDNHIVIPAAFSGRYSAPDSINTSDSMDPNIYNGFGLRLGWASTTGGISGSTVTEMCGEDGRSGNNTTLSAYEYYCTLQIN